ncbi:heparinase II/III family protein [Streptomyces sp. NPDC087270]|uniref:heparinase II/III domain-containing protein n=1 Tax=Streptomyces sp. NPDC087270 TaxID=3365774 RepID=UPI003827AC6F
MTPDWPEVVRRVDDHAWARDITDHVRADFDRWQPGLVIPGPATPTAWTHHYFCDDDGSALTFAPDSPHRHVCASCGRVYRGEPWDGAWRTTVHNCVAAQAQRAALVLRLSPEPAQRERARAALERIFATYTRDYPAYQPHGVHAGRGRVQPQSLDEAVWAVLLLRALRWAGPDALSAGTRAALPRFARAVADLLRPQISAIHNIHCWLLAAVAECAALLADRELLDWCRDGEFGARAQIARGFHAEGLWFESNAHYHYYAVAALLSYREATGPDGLDQDSAARLSRAVSAPPRLAYSDTRLPAYGDGWPDCWTADFAPHAEAAWTLLPERPVDPAPYYRVPRPGPVRLWGGADLPGGVGVLGPRRSVAALVFGPDELVSPPGDDERSLVWPEAGVAVLRSDRARLTLRFGPDGGWHDHRDKLAVDAETAGGWQSLDLGTSGYGARFTAWMRSPVAHNLMICDGRRQPAHTGRLLHASEHRVSAQSAWDGHTLRRTLQLADDGWTDVFEAEAPATGLLEWVFHGDGAFAPGAGHPALLTDDGPDQDASDRDALGQDAGSASTAAGGSPRDPEHDTGHGWLREVRRLPVPADRRLTGAWDAAGSPVLELDVPQGFVAYAAVADGNPTGLPLGVVLLRGRARRARIEARFRLPDRP